MGLVHVKDKNGQEANVDETWLDRWPDDFTPITDESEAAETAPVSPPDGDEPPATAGAAKPQGTNKKEN